MTRSERMQPVQQVVDVTERRYAEQLAASEARVAEAELKLHELEQYGTDYQRAYSDRMSTGMSSSGLRDYQAFLARLNDAVRQQTQLVNAARNERDLRRRQWQDAARHAKAIDRVVENWQDEERLNANRREQRESDERAQRTGNKQE